jgi:hypothetical protein
MPDGSPAELAVRKQFLPRLMGEKDATKLAQYDAEQTLNAAYLNRDDLTVPAAFRKTATKDTPLPKITLSKHGRPQFIDDIPASAVRGAAALAKSTDSEPKILPPAVCKFSPRST